MTIDLRLATTIPVGQIVNAGQEVYPVLRSRLAGNDRLLALVNERDRLGQEKHGQPLMTGDERNTNIEITGEVLDAMAYITKKWMQTGDYRWRAMLDLSIALADDILDVIEETEAQP